MSQYDDLIRADGDSILRQLYPHDFALQDCPMSADALDDYLRTGQIVPAPLSIVSRYDITASFRRCFRSLAAFLLSLARVVAVVAEPGSLAKGR